jgi:hypothetical protein
MASYRNVVVSATLALSLVSSTIASPSQLLKRNDTPPKPPCQAFKPFEYLGCYVETGSPRTLLYSPNLTFGTMTIEACQASCKVSVYPQIFTRFSSLPTPIIRPMDTNMPVSSTTESVSAVPTLEEPLLLRANATSSAQVIRVRSAVGTTVFPFMSTLPSLPWTLARSLQAIPPLVATPKAPAIALFLSAKTNSLPRP